MRQPVPFGKYLLLDRISVGGMAEVFKAKSFGVEGFEKVIAIKRILPSMCEDQDFIKMFIDEAKIAGQLSHANICQIFELGRVETSHFIAMEYIWGRDLLQIQNRLRQRGQSMPVDMACYVIAQICEGLDYAHTKKDALGRPLKIIHRDCSPQNALVSYEGEVKVIDFGIAKAASRSSRTNAGVLKGKFGYMSPEQVRGLPLDRRSDIFALGTVLYECLTGQRLFLGESDFSTLEKVRNADFAPPSSINADIPSEVERIVMKSLTRDPDDRYQWCGEMRSDLHAYLTTRDKAFTAKTLSDWMRTVFGKELAAERKLMEEYKSIGREGLVAGVPHAKAELDVVSELGEAGKPEGDPTMLDGGPPLAESLVSAPPRFSTTGRETGDGDFLDVAGEVESQIDEDDLDAKTVLQDMNQKVAVDDPVIGQLAESQSSARPPIPALGPPMPPPQRSRPPTHEPTGGAAAQGSEPKTISSTGVRALSPSRRASEFGFTTEAVEPLGAAPGLSPFRRFTRRSRWIRDVGIAVGIAVAVLGLFVLGKALFSGEAVPAPAPGKGALAILAADGKPVEVYLNGASVGTTEEGKPITLEGLAAGEYTVELRRDKAAPCVQTVTVAERVEVVSCKFAGPAPTTGRLKLQGLLPEYRIYIDEIEISAQAAAEPIPLTPGRVHAVEVRAEGASVQTFQVEVKAGEELSRTITPVTVAKVENATEVEDAKDDKPVTNPEPKPRRKPRDEERTPSKRDEPAPEAKPEVGYLTAKTKPWARVLIDGRDTGKMTPIPPRTKLALRPGSHKVTFVVDGKPYSYKVQVIAGETTHIEKSLDN